MKKILFLLLYCLIKLNAYEYNFCVQGEDNYNYQRYIINNTSLNNIMSIRVIRLENGIINWENINHSHSSFYFTLGYIGRHYSFISKSTFNSYFSNDLNFLNDLYSQQINPFLNYLYNPNRFYETNFIDYQNYELFYNEDGLAVESKVNGIYKGLYDDIGQSGILYNSVGEVVLVNGVEPSFLTKQWLKLQNKVINPLLSVFSISNIWKNILCVVVILASLRMLIRYSFKAFLIRLYSKRIKHYENTITRIENA